MKKVVRVPYNDEIHHSYREYHREQQEKHKKIQHRNIVKQQKRLEGFDELN